MSWNDPPEGRASRPNLPHLDPVAMELTSTIQGGDLDRLRRLIAERPDLARARMIGRHGPTGGWRTPLHATTDWPGYFPGAPQAAALLLDAGADPNDDTGGERPETPLHWAASSDDVDVAIVLIDGGADLETPGGSIGTPLDNAIGYSCWHVARLLVARGAKVEKLWHAAALGMLSRTEELLRGTVVSAPEISQAFGTRVRRDSGEWPNTCRAAAQILAGSPITREGPLSTLPAVSELAKRTWSRGFANAVPFVRGPVDNRHSKTPLFRRTRARFRGYGTGYGSKGASGDCGPAGV